MAVTCPRSHKLDMAKMSVVSPGGKALPPKSPGTAKAKLSTGGKGGDATPTSKTPTSKALAPKSPGIAKKASKEAVPSPASGKKPTKGTPAKGEKGAGSGKKGGGTGAGGGKGGEEGGGKKKEAVEIEHPFAHDPSDDCETSFQVLFLSSSHQPSGRPGQSTFSAPRLCTGSDADFCW